MKSAREGMSQEPRPQTPEVSDDQSDPDAARKVRRIMNLDDREVDRAKQNGLKQVFRDI